MTFWVILVGLLVDLWEDAELWPLCGDPPSSPCLSLLPVNSLILSSPWDKAKSGRPREQARPALGTRGDINSCLETPDSRANKAICQE